MQHHMWAALIFLLLLTAAATAATSAATTRGRGCPLSCGGVDIPYPFGVGAGCFRKGFEIECTKGGPVLAGTPLRVVKLSLDPDESQVMLPIGSQCFNTSSPAETSDIMYGETMMNEHGVYRISDTHNMLVVVGCNTVGYIASKETVGGGEDYAYNIGCMSYCNNSESAQNGHCKGVGCCHVDIPPGLTDNYFDFDNEYDHTAMMNFSSCDYAFLVDKNNYTFHRSDLKMDRSRTSLVWLDWAIRGSADISGNDILSCKQAATTSQHACVSNHSDCVDSINGPGYNCKCSKGYAGNAYVVDGCTNVDECANPAKYPCYGVCRDTQGGYECDCPTGYRSHDPRTERCTLKFPLAAQISVGAIGGILVLAFLAFFFVLRKEKQKARDFYRKNGGLTLENARTIKIYTREDLKPFLKSSNFIGKGGFGEVYKGVVDGVLVAIKKPIGAPLEKSEKKPSGDDNAQENDQFPNEVCIQSKVIHRNIVRLIGCCLEVDTPMLVYEFISNGSLDVILHHDKKKQLLSLDVRLSILQESANGLNYMHTETNNKILHGDVKPANILLDDNFKPKISDFGISRLMAKGKEHTSNIIGDRTYADPVFLQTGQLTDRSDVYSFGLVIVEVISRKKATYFGDNSLVKSFLDCHREGKKATELFDKEIATTENLEILDNLNEIAMQCLSLDVDQRPPMKDVKQWLHLLQGSNRP